MRVREWLLSMRIRGFCCRRRALVRGRGSTWVYTGVQGGLRGGVLEDGYWLVVIYRRVV